MKRRHHKNEMAFIISLIAIREQIFYKVALSYLLVVTTEISQYILQSDKCLVEIWLT